MCTKYTVKVRMIITDAPWPSAHALWMAHPHHNLCQLCGTGCLHSISKVRLQRSQCCLGKYTAVAISLDGYLQVAGHQLCYRFGSFFHFVNICVFEQSWWSQLYRMLCQSFLHTALIQLLHMCLDAAARCQALILRYSWPARLLKKVGIYALCPPGLWELCARGSVWWCSVMKRVFSMCFWLPFHALHKVWFSRYPWSIARLYNVAPGIGLTLNLPSLCTWSLHRIIACKLCPIMQCVMMQKTSTDHFQPFSFFLFQPLDICFIVCR